MKRFIRPANTTQVSNLYIVLPEGTKTEKEYFKQADRLFYENRNNEKGYGLILLKPGANNSPVGLINEIKKYLRSGKYRENYEAWIVFDRDQWNDRDLDAVESWRKENSHHHFALSHPCFEYWLLLHFEDISGSLSASELTHRLKKYLSDYNKSVPRGFVAMDRVKRACNSARVKFRQSPDLRSNNGSTVYQLIEMLAKEAGIDLS